MNKARMHIVSMAAAFGLVAVTGGTAMADDIELFIAGEDTSIDNGAQPNVLFVIDTSGSMTSEVVTQVAWDPNTTFDDCYRSDAIYWGFSSTAPSCNSNHWFYKTKNMCQASSGSLDGIGEWSGSALAYRSNRNRWVRLRASRKNRDVECEDDAGVHGSISGSYWAANGNAGPWAGNDNSEPQWNYNYTFFDGNYLNWLNSDGEVTTTHIDIVKDVTVNLLDNLNGVNVGMMRFNQYEGGSVDFAMENIATARSNLQDAVQNLSIDIYTPLSETLYEAYLYYTGGNVDYGDGYEHTSVASSRVGNTTASGQYQTPIEFACQKNYIIFLTDGAATRDAGAESKIEGLPNFGQYTGTSACLDGDSAADGRSGICLDEMAAYMQNKDISPLYGEQNVTTYTIGFTVDLELLADTAEKGGGEYHLADDTTSLTSALTKITVSILDDAATFTAPSVPVNAFNRTQNLKDVFVSVFNPSSTVHWPGNMKKYRLVSGQLIDANGTLAVDPVTGFFREGSRSYWSDEPDDDRAADGGAAGELPYWGDRLLFTNIAGGDLNSAANRVWPGTVGLDEDFMGVPVAQDSGYYDLWEIEKLLLWMNGLDVFDDDDDGDDVDTRNMMGDPLHVKPVPVIYGGPADAPDMVVYTATNDGYLHAIDPTDGSELWTFVPERMLPLMYNQYLDQPTTTRTYGLDGEIKHVVLNDDGKGGIAGTERAILLFGMRRGGDVMFALDVTDRYDPQLLWVADSETEGFEDLGQTWSTPQVAEVNVGGTARDVAIFAGGYDTGQDDDDYTTDSQGNAIYMVDLVSGQLIWSGGAADGHDLVLDEMEHSIPAPMTVLDVNNDGYGDRMYVGDMGGRVWRFDIFNGESVDDLVHGGVIASLGGAAEEGGAGAADLRRFYNQVDVVDVIRKEYRYLALNVGSGYRAHPLDRDIEEEFFSIRDYDIFPQLHTDDYDEPVVIDEVIDITDLSSAHLDSDDKGWRLRMEKAPGEKILNRSVTFQDAIYFTSFAPGTGANACTAAPGQNRLYKIDLASGDPVANLDDSVDDDLNEDDRSTELKQGGIAPGVEIFFTDSDDGDDDDDCEEGEDCGPKPNCGSGLEFIGQCGDPVAPVRTFWTQDGT